MVLFLFAATSDGCFTRACRWSLAPARPLYHLPVWCPGGVISKVTCWSVVTVNANGQPNIRSLPFSFCLFCNTVYQSYTYSLLSPLKLFFTTSDHYQCQQPFFQNNVLSHATRSTPHIDISLIVVASMLPFHINCQFSNHRFSRISLSIMFIVGAKPVGSFSQSIILSDFSMAKP